MRVAIGPPDDATDDGDGDGARLARPPPPLAGEGEGARPRPFADDDAGLAARAGDGARRGLRVARAYGAAAP